MATPVQPLASAPTAVATVGASRRKKSSRRRIFFWLILGAFVIFGVELTAGLINAFAARRFGRIDLDQTAVLPHPWRSHALNTTYGTGSPASQAKHYQTHNSQGFKYPRDVPKEKPARMVRIFAMGGSTLYGWGAEGLPLYGNHPHLANDETITFHLERLLARRLEAVFPGRRLDVEVVNLGVPDYNSSMHLIYFNEVVYEYHPDLVLFVDGNNEMYGTKALNPLADYHNSGVSVVESFNDRGKLFALYVASRYLATHLETARSFQYYFMNRWLAREAPPRNPIYDVPEDLSNLEADYTRRARDTFLRAYVQLKAGIGYLGAPMIVFLQPQLQVEDPALLGTEDLRTLTIVNNEWKGSATVTRTEFMNRVREMLPGLLGSIGVEFHDVSQLGASEHQASRLYIDYTHVTPEGAKACAAKMFPWVWPKVEVIARKLGD